MNNLRAFVKNKNLLIRIILSYVLVGLLVIAGPRRVDFDIYGKEYRANLISILYLNAGGRATTGTMMLNLDQAMLQSMVMNGDGMVLSRR